MLNNNPNNRIPKMRTISAAINEIKGIDPNTCFTEHTLRKAVVTKVIPSVKAGKKYLVDMDAVYAYLDNFLAA